MKNIINYFYKISIDKLYEKNEVYYFYVEDVKFCFTKFDRNLNDIDMLVEISNSLYNMNVLVHTFIKNINDKYITPYNSNNYVLLRINHVENDKLDIIDIAKFNNLLITKESVLYQKKWFHRWTETIDRYEMQVSEFNKEYKDLVENFDYFIGLAENAVSYVGNIPENSESTFCLSHNKIFFPTTYNNIYNSLNFVFDNISRDIAEYIKINYFYGNFEIDFLIKYINLYKPKKSDIEYLFARLLYPSYYFDIFNDAINGKEYSNKLKKVLYLSTSYEIFLQDTYKYLKTYYDIEEIEWISKINN